MAGPVARLSPLVIAAWPLPIGPRRMAACMSVPRLEVRQPRSAQHARDGAVKPGHGLTAEDGRLDQAFLTSLNALDESIPLLGAEDQGWSRGILGVAYCSVAFRKLRHLHTSVRLGLG